MITAAGLLRSLGRPRTGHGAGAVALGACVGMLAVGAPPAAGVSFSGPTNFAVGEFPSLVAVGDFNADKRLDLATSNEHSNNVSIVLGAGNGSFSAPTNFATGDNPQMVALGDFNADARLDLAVPNYSGNVSILLGNGAGGFSAPTNFAAGANPIGVAVADFNTDRRPDLAVANQGSNNVSILLGRGAGAFSAPTNFAAGSGPNNVVVGDFNIDGRPDLAVPNRDSGNVSILLGNGPGTFSSPTNLAAGNTTFQVTVGDLNVDARSDLAIASFFADASIYLGNGTGGFSGPTHFSAGTSPNSVAAADFDADARRDLVFSNFNLVPATGKSSVAVFPGNGTGAFSSHTDFTTNGDSNNVGVGDFNGDARPDLAVTNLSTNDVSVLLNTTGSPSSYRDVVLGDHPRGYWRLAESSGSTASDSSPFANHGTYRGGPGLGVAGALAVDPNTAVRLDGRDDTVRVPDSPSLHSGDQFSLEVWLKRAYLSTANTTEGLFAKGYQVFLDGGNFGSGGWLVLRKPNVDVIARSTSRITDTNFHHVVVTKSGPSVHLYIDGVDATGPVGNRTISDTSGPLDIGAGAASPFRGILDEAAVYDYALTPAQVGRHYDLGRVP